MKSYQSLKNKTIYSAAIIGLIAVPAFAQDKEEELLPPSEFSSNETAGGDIVQDETAQDETIEQTSDDEIDAELAAELERLERLEKLSDPTEFLESIALQKPLIELPVPDAARLEIAQKIVARLFPVGTSERAVKSNMEDLIIPMMDRALDLTIIEAIELFGLPEDTIPASQKDEADKKIIAILEESQPNFRKDLDTLIDAYIEITALSSEPIEPALAGAMARDYARKYDLAQLNDLDQFFATDTGGIFARDFMLSTASIDMIQTALKEFPVIAENSEKIQEVSKSLEGLFKPVKAETDTIEDDCIDCEDEDSDETTEDIFANDDGTEPWFDQDNWEASDKENVDQLQDTYNEVAQLSEDAYAQYEEAYDAALSKNREKYIADGWSREKAGEE